MYLFLTKIGEKRKIIQICIKWKSYKSMEKKLNVSNGKCSLFCLVFLFSKIIDCFEITK